MQKATLLDMLRTPALVSMDTDRDDFHCSEQQSNLLHIHPVVQPYMEILQSVVHPRNLILRK